MYIMETKMSNNFDLETKMMDCWGVVDDIKFLYEEFHDGVKPMSPDQQANLLLGLHQMYELKFERLWDEFERICGHGGIFLSESEVLLCKQHRDYDRKLDEMLDDDGWKSYKWGKYKTQDFSSHYERVFGVKKEEDLEERTDIIGQNDDNEKKVNLEEYLLRLRQWDD